MNKETEVQKEEVIINVDNTTKEPENLITLSDVVESKKNDNDLSKTSQISVDPSLVNNSNVSFQAKSQKEDKKFSGTLSYEDILSQTQELVEIKNTNIDYIAEEAKLRKEKIEGLVEHFNDLNAQPLSSIDSYSNYNLVLNKSI